MKTGFQILADGHRSATTHSGHFGFRAMQTCRPWKINRWDSKAQESWGKSFIRACSIFTGSVCRVKPSR